MQPHAASCYPHGINIELWACLQKLKLVSLELIRVSAQTLEIF